MAGDGKIRGAKAAFPRVPVNGNDDHVRLCLDLGPKIQPQIVHLQINQPKPIVLKAEEGKQDSQNGGQSQADRESQEYL
jgi:hypothetical protein